MELKSPAPSGLFVFNVSVDHNAAHCGRLRATEPRRESRRQNVGCQKAQL
jgi:hypothetical protein